jgi:hypothetical protein
MTNCKALWMFSRIKVDTIPGGYVTNRELVKFKPDGSYGFDFAPFNTEKPKRSILLIESDQKYYSSGSISQGNGFSKVFFGRFLLTETTDDVPQILRQPQPASGTVGSTVTLSVKAVGLFKYQWYFGSNALANSPGIRGAQSSTLKLGPLTTSQAGRYRVSVKNSSGRIYSAWVKVKVSQAP